MENGKYGKYGLIYRVKKQSYYYCTPSTRTRAPQNPPTRTPTRIHIYNCYHIFAVFLENPT